MRLTLSVSQYSDLSREDAKLSLKPVATSDNQCIIPYVEINLEHSDLIPPNTTVERIFRRLILTCELFETLRIYQSKPYGKYVQKCSVSISVPKILQRLNQIQIHFEHQVLPF